MRKRAVEEVEDLTLQSSLFSRSIVRETTLSMAEIWVRDLISGEEDARDGLSLSWGFSPRVRGTGYPPGAGQIRSLLACLVLVCLPDAAACHAFYWVEIQMALRRTHAADPGASRIGGPQTDNDVNCDRKALQSCL